MKQFNTYHFFNSIYSAILEQVCDHKVQSCEPCRTQNYTSDKLIRKITFDESLHYSSDETGGNKGKSSNKGLRSYSL